MSADRPTEAEKAWKDEVRANPVEGNEYNRQKQRFLAGFAAGRESNYVTSGNSYREGLENERDAAGRENAALRERLDEAEKERGLAVQRSEGLERNLFDVNEGLVAAERDHDALRKALEEIGHTVQHETWIPNAPVPDRQGVEAILLKVSQKARDALASPDAATGGTSEEGEE